VSVAVHVTVGEEGDEQADGEPGLGPVPEMLVKVEAVAIAPAVAFPGQIAA
jgi:hypothetical protein